MAAPLPDENTCADCRHVVRCVAFGFSWPERKSCDFIPSRFQSGTPPLTNTSEAERFRDSNRGEK